MPYRKVPRALINPVAVTVIRELQNLSQSEVSRRTGGAVTRGYISQIERGAKADGLTVKADRDTVELDNHGRARIGLATANAIAGALGVPLMAILAMPVRDCRQPTEVAS